MMANFRLGFPYAREHDEDRNSVVVVKRHKYKGFRTILDEKKKECSLLDNDLNILKDFNYGVIGELLEGKEGNTIVENGFIHGDGSSMQLAVVLAACSDVEPSEDSPFLLFSAEVQTPFGAKPFIDATIQTYCSEKEIIECIKSKYEAAIELNSQALIVPYRDGKILERLVGIPCHSIKKILEIQNGDELVIIGVKSNELPDLAKLIGISPYHFMENKINNVVNKIFSIIICVLFLLLAFSFVIISKSKTSDSNFLKRRKIPENQNANEVNNNKQMFSSRQNSMKNEINKQSEASKEKINKQPTSKFTVKQNALVLAEKTNYKEIVIERNGTLKLSAVNYVFEKLILEENSSIILVQPTTLTIKILEVYRASKIVYKRCKNIKVPPQLKIHIADGSSITGNLYISGSGTDKGESGIDMLVTIGKLSTHGIIKIESNGKDGDIGGNGGNIEFLADTLAGENKISQQIGLIEKNIFANPGIGKDLAQGKAGIIKIKLETPREKEENHTKILDMFDLEQPYLHGNK